MPICRVCKQDKRLDCFYKYAVNRSGHRYECMLCTKAQNDRWKKTNKERRRAVQAEYRRNNIHRVSAYNKAWARRNAGLVNFYARSYQLLKRRAQPLWLSGEHLEDLKNIYNWRPDGCHVDHIVPLNGANVCGLHVPWNLQYLTASENQKKHNKVAA